MDSILSRPPFIDPAAFLAPTATVIADVTIGPEVSIWFGAVLRGDSDRIVIGAGSNIQDNAVLHCDPGAPCLIGKNVTIGHGAVVHGCMIEDGALIGMNATVLNCARIGAGAIIAAGALVSPGVEIPPRTLAVGVPARVVRVLRPDESAAAAAGAETYRRRAAEYRRHFEAQS